VSLPASQNGAYIHSFNRTFLPADGHWLGKPGSQRVRLAHSAHFNWLAKNLSVPLQVLQLHALAYKPKNTSGNSEVFF
jgi:hypothetical protein